MTGRGLHLNVQQRPQRAATAANPVSVRIARAFGSYSEWSRSGKGLHIFIKGHLAGSGIKRKRGNVDIEIYDHGRFIICTGNVLDDVSARITEQQELLDTLIERLRHWLHRIKTVAHIGWNRVPMTGTNFGKIGSAFCRGAKKFNWICDRFAYSLTLTFTGSVPLLCRENIAGCGWRGSNLTNCHS